MSNQQPTTDQQLLALLEQAKHHKLTPNELFEQRVSFVYGQLGPDNKLTKDEVRSIILRCDQ